MPTNQKGKTCNRNSVTDQKKIKQGKHPQKSKSHKEMERKIGKKREEIKQMPLLFSIPIF